MAFGIAHDLQGPTPGHGAYVNPNGIDTTQRNGFFEALDEAEAGARSAAIVARQPTQWETMEEGVFANRPGRPARIASKVGDALQKAYATDASLLKARLRQVGFSALDADMLACLQEMAASPLELWLEFDVLPNGSVGDTLGADLLFGGSVLSRRRATFAEGDAATVAMHALERRGLADERWRRLVDASMATIVRLDAEPNAPFFLMTSSPTFVKAKWVPGMAPLAKIYQSCDAKLLR